MFSFLRVILVQEVEYSFGSIARIAQDKDFSLKILKF